MYLYNIVKKSGIVNFTQSTNIIRINFSLIPYETSIMVGLFIFEIKKVLAIYLCGFTMTHRLHTC